MGLKKRPIISVIMPVYNAHLYVAKTIESVLQQSFRDFELIIVDDGATDGSAEICQQYATQDDRIVFIHEENGGICKARNTGLQAAQGTYIAFCDHDDLYMPNYLEKALEAAMKNYADLVKFAYRSEYSRNGNVYRVFEEAVPDTTRSLEWLVENDYPLFDVTRRAIWNGLYRKKLIDQYNITFDESVHAGMEDYLFNLDFFLHLQKVTFIPDKLFIHYGRSGQSTSEKYNETRLPDIIKSARKESEFFMKYSVPPQLIVQHRYKYISLSARTLCHPDCPMDLDTKVRWLCKLRTEDTLNCANLLHAALQQITKKPKIAIQGVLYEIGCDRLLISIWQWHERMKRRL